MRILAAILLVVGIVVSPLHGQEVVDRLKTLTLSQAVELAGPRAAGLPIVLATMRHEEVSSDAEAWTVYGDDGRPRQIVVYTESVTFRCASRQPRPSLQCRLKLASIIVHEAWHFSESGDDARAYQEQLAFLIMNGASSAVIGSVRRSRDHAVDKKRKLYDSKAAPGANRTR